jgi:hypothetical protein
MTMDFRFYKADPEPTANVQWPAVDPDTDPTFTLVALQRDADPDANTHDGFDYFGAYGVGDDIDAWAGGQPVTAIAKDQLPNPVTFYPAPFNEA